MHKSAKTGMEAFFTRKASNEGIELPLYAPDGTKTEHWIRIRGVDSDAFRLADAEERRRMIEIVRIEDPREQQLALHQSRLRLLSALVISWSFEEECTLDKVMEFLREAPQIADAIDHAATKRALFLGNGSSSSRPSPSTSSSST